jgi:hypothetical protein
MDLHAPDQKHLFALFSDLCNHCGHTFETAQTLLSVDELQDLLQTSVVECHVNDDLAVGTCAHCRPWTGLERFRQIQQTFSEAWIFKTHVTASDFARTLCRVVQTKSIHEQILWMHTLLQRYKRAPKRIWNPLIRYKKQCILYEQALKTRCMQRLYTQATDRCGPIPPELKQHVLSFLR